MKKLLHKGVWFFGGTSSQLYVNTVIQINYAVPVILFKEIKKGYNIFEIPLYY